MIRTDRVVESVEGDRVTLDVPLSDALDSKFTAAALVHYSFPGRIAEVGVDGLRIAAAPGQKHESSSQGQRAAEPVCGLAPLFFC